MNAPMQIALGLAVLTSVAAAAAERPPRAEMPQAQAQAKQTACSLVDAAEMKRLTGRQDFLKRGPMVDEPSTPAPERSACSYLGFTFELVSPAKPELFARERTFVEKGGAKTQPVSGVGDQAFYWWSPKPGSSRPVGIILRAKTGQLMIMDMTTSDSIEIVKPQLLAVAKAVAPKLK